MRENIVSCDEHHRMCKVQADKQANVHSHHTLNYAILMLRNAISIIWNSIRFIVVGVPPKVALHDNDFILSTKMHLSVNTKKTVL